MILLLRFIGVMNAAVWFGAAVFFTVGVAPAFFTPEMKRLLGEVYNGVVAQLVLERYFHLHYWCGAVALAHLLAEWVYLGRKMQRFTLGLLGTIFVLALVGGLWLQPKLKGLHLTMHARPELVQAEVRTNARQSFRLWHGVSSSMNLCILLGLGIYFWRVANPSDIPRFVSATKFRS